MYIFFVIQIQISSEDFSYSNFANRYGLDPIRNDTSFFIGKESPYTMRNCQYFNSSDSLWLSLPLKFHSFYQFQLINCTINRCYSFVDQSRALKSSPLYSSSSLLSVNFINATSGTNSAGWYFRPQSENVTITITTKSCGEFYKIHQFNETENCESSRIYISNILSGLPMC